MLCIDFTTEDLNRLRSAGDTSPMWEAVLSLQLLQTRHAALVFDPWRRQVRSVLARRGLTGTVQSLMRLCPNASYFPDFLTPSGTGTDLDSAIDRVLCTPKARLSHELGRLFADSPAPRGARQLAAGEAASLRRLGDALRRYYDVAVAPYHDAIRAAVAADHSVRSSAALKRGAEGLLTSYQPELIRRHGRLECAYPIERELALRGRPLTLIPSFFCTRWPVALADPELPPDLVYPLAPAPGWLRPAGVSRDSDPADGALGRLIGATRAQVLDVLDRPLSTGRIATELRLAPASASRHAAVLREAGLVVSQRQGHRVLHRRTSLGEALLNDA